jgi:hypothetical protein
MSQKAIQPPRTTIAIRHATTILKNRLPLADVAFISVSSFAGGVSGVEDLEFQHGSQK